jgi:hypothetical protein
MERFVFFVYTVISSDERNKPGSKEPVYSTLFLISFFQLFLLLPVILLVNEVFEIERLQAVLSFPKVLRYLVIFGAICVIGSVNYYFLARNNRMERLAEKYAGRKEAYLKRKWLLMVFAMLLGVVVIGALTMMKVMLK